MSDTQGFTSLLDQIRAARVPNRTVRCRSCDQRFEARSLTAVGVGKLWYCLKCASERGGALKQAADVRRALLKNVRDSEQMEGSHDAS